MLRGVQLPASSQSCHLFRATNGKREVQVPKATKRELFYSIVFLLHLPACMACVPLTVALKTLVITVLVWTLHCIFS